MPPAYDIPAVLLARLARDEKARQWCLAYDFQQSPIDDRLLMLSAPDLLATWDFVW